MSVRIVNPLSGTEVFGPTTGHTVEPVDHPPAGANERWFHVAPSFRPGMPYDLVGYPADWVKDEAVAS